jgi:hypothetical protein
MAGDADRVVVRLRFCEDGGEVGELEAGLVGVAVGAVSGNAGRTGEVTLGADTVALVVVEFFGIDDRGPAGGGQVTGGVAVAALAADARCDREGGGIEGGGMTVEATGLDGAGEIELGAALKAGGELPLRGFRVEGDRGLE